MSCKNTDGNVGINNKQSGLHNAFRDPLRGSPEGEDPGLEECGAFVVEADRRVRSGVFTLRALCLFWRFWAREKTPAAGEAHSRGSSSFINCLFNNSSKHRTVQLA